MSIQDLLKAKLGTDVPELDGQEEPVVQDEGFEHQEGTIADALQAMSLKTAFAEASSYEPPEGAYENLRLHSVVTANGVAYKPNIYGFYEPSDNEEVKELLAYYALKGLVRLVTKVL